MTPLRLHGQPVDTVFDLLGRKENDLTYALGWALSNSQGFLERFLGTCDAPTDGVSATTIDLQQRGADSGITDIELLSSSSHVIVEAKRGFALPSAKQLERYGARLDDSGATDRRFVVLTQWDEAEFVRYRLGSDLRGHPITTVGIGRVGLLARDVANLTKRPSERHLLAELAAYLLANATMRDMRDNRVWVVSLSGKASEAGISFIDVVRRLGIYWYPGSGTWPKTPANYVGFRYGGRLQSIHHVEEAKLWPTLGSGVPEASSATWGPAWVLRLGPAIVPPKPTPTGKGIVRSSHRWIDIDLLLTAETVTEAWTRQVERHRETEGS